MDEVAQRADVSKQTVYAQFASKEALFVAMVGAMTSAAAGQVNNEVGVVPRDGKEVAGYLRAYAERQLMVVLTPRLMQLRRLVIGEAGRFPQLGRAVYEGGPMRAIGAVASALKNLADRGLLAIDDPVMAASHFNWLVMGDPVNRAMLLGDDAIPDPCGTPTSCGQRCSRVSRRLWSQKLIQRRWGLLLRILVTLAALSYVAHRVPLGQVKAAIAAASVPLILLGFGAQLAVRAVNSLRVRIIARAQGAPLSYRAILTTMFTTAFYGLMLPGSVGAGAATLVKYLGHGVTPAAALASMIVNRLLDTCATATLGLVFWGFAHYGQASGTQGPCHLAVGRGSAPVPRLSPAPVRSPACPSQHSDREPASRTGASRQRFERHRTRNRSMRDRWQPVGH